jgi:hypothetical protein
MFPAISMTAPSVRPGPRTAAVSATLMPFWMPTAAPSGASANFQCSLVLYIGGVELRGASSRR